MDKYTELMNLHLDGELADADKDILVQHLKTNKTAQQEFQALKGVDQLLLEAPLLAPPEDFLAQFETRLDRRLNQRRNLIGASIIGLVLTLAAGLLVWSFADIGLALLGLVNGVNLFGSMIDFRDSLLTILGVTIRMGATVTESIFRLVNYPIFWGYLLMVMGLVSLWAQLLKRVTARSALVEAKS